MTGRSTKAQLEAWQGVAALVGITLGVIPLVQLALGRGPGLWSVVVGATTGPAAWGPPLGLLVVAVAVVAWLARLERGR